MSIKHQVISVLNRVLEPIDTQIIRKSEFEKLKNSVGIKTTFASENDLSPEAEAYLKPDNPRLLELTKRYDSIRNPALSRSRWTKEYISKNIDLSCFRGNNAYVFNDRNNELTFVLTARYLREINSKKLLDRLIEDGLFGAELFEAEPGRVVSRDLLDSISEIYFLDESINISKRPDFEVLDIGAGYGRFAHRLVEAHTNIKKVFCVDVIPKSTFCSEFYLKYRGVQNKAVVVRLDQIDEIMSQSNVQLAVNIHSFSECPLAAIEWWIKSIKRLNIRYLMIVPNAAGNGGRELLSQEIDGQAKDYSPVLEANGYRRISKRPKFEDEMIQRLGVSPTYYYLYELASA